MKFNFSLFLKTVSLTDIEKEILKLADIIAVYKKDSRYEKSNYRLNSVLSNLSKIIENVLYDQISSSFFFENFFSKY